MLYVGSTIAQNAPMRRVFEKLDCEVLGRRFFHGLRLTGR
jgi:RimJ/RimL family protein N-acetyltransferase